MPIQYFTLLAYTGLFILVLVLLIFTTTEDSAGRPNNVLLIYYVAVALWVVGCMGGVVSQFVSAWAQLQTAIQVTSVRSAGRIPSMQWHQHTSHYSVIVWGLVLNGIIYVMRRPEWARMIIDGISAWKKERSKAYAQEMLVQHAIHHPEDREWVEKALRLILSEGKPEASSSTQPTPMLDKPPAITSEQAASH